MEWQSKFHPEKCKCTRFGRSNVQNHEYTIYGRIKEILKEKDIGKVFDDKLNFLDHLSEVNNANNIMGTGTFVHLDLEHEAEGHR